MRTIFEPGWRWSECVKPVAGTDSCQTHHFGYCISGRMHVVMDTGEEMDVGPGDAVDIPAGHDAVGRRRGVVCRHWRDRRRDVRARL